MRAFFCLYAPEFPVPSLPGLSGQSRAGRAAIELWITRINRVVTGLNASGLPSRTHPETLVQIAPLQVFGKIAGVQRFAGGAFEQFRR
jgi:hypothetical protein